MTVGRPFVPPRTRILFGITLLLCTSALSWARWRFDVQRHLKQLEYVERNRSPGDSALLATMSYHAAHARVEYANRWTPLGYATVGVVGAVFGLLLCGSGIRALRRS